MRARAAALELWILVPSFPADNKLGQPRARDTGLALLGSAIAVGRGFHLARIRAPCPLLRACLKVND